jgi:hypothetical protein
MKNEKDEELLELAAKAVGIDDYQTVCQDAQYGPYWDPLIDDGDALRVAARLRLIVKPGKHKGDGCTVESQREGIAGCTAFRDDPAEQMRIAIVTVAAEIGKEMK